MICRHISADPGEFSLLYTVRQIYRGRFGRVPMAPERVVDDIAQVILGYSVDRRSCDPAVTDQCLVCFRDHGIAPIPELAIAAKMPVEPAARLLARERRRPEAHGDRI